MYTTNKTDMQNRQNGLDERFIIAFFVIVLQFIYYWLIFSLRIHNHLDLTNIEFYVVGSGVFVFTLIILVIIDRKTFFPKRIIVYRTTGLIATIWEVCFIYSAYSLETEMVPDVPNYAINYLRHVVPEAFYFLCLALFTFIIWRCIRIPIKDNMGYRRIITMFVSLLQAWFLFTPNPFRDNVGGLYHIDAYTNQIINVLNLMPYEQYSMGVYGHYGIMCFLPIKIMCYLGLNKWIACTFCIAIVGFITFFLENHMISKYIHHDIIYMVSVIANMIISTQLFNNQVYQLFPHRLFFPAITMYCLPKIYSLNGNDRRKWRILLTGMLIPCSLVWNIETGIVCVITWTFGNIIIDRILIRSIIQALIKWFCLALVQITIAYLIVGGYNYLAGGDWPSLALFIYPLGSTYYKVSDFQFPLQSPLAGYFYVIAVLLGTIAFLAKSILNNTLSETGYALLVVSFLGYGVFMYYINRVVSPNASISFFSVVFASGVICDYYSQSAMISGGWKDRFLLQSAVSCISLTVLCSMSLATITSLGGAIHNRMITTKETESLDEFLKCVCERIPDEAVAFGIGTTQLFSLLNRDTGIYICDWEDIESVDHSITVNPDAIRELETMIEYNRYSFILVNQIENCYIPDEYKLIDSFDYSGQVFEVYECM